MVRVVVVGRALVVRVAVIVRMGVTVAAGELERCEAEPGRDQNRPDDRVLRALRPRAELQPDGDDDRAEHDRDEHVRDPCQAGQPGDPRQRVAAGAAEHRQRHPVVGQDRVPEPDARRSREQRRRGSAHTASACSAGRAARPETEVLGVRDRLGQQQAHVVVVQRVDHLAPLTLADDEPQVTEHAQLLGDGRLPHADGLGELADRTRAGRQPAEDPHPAGRRQRLHRLRHRARGVGRDQREIKFVPMTHADLIVCTFVHGSPASGPANERPPLGARAGRIAPCQERLQKALLRAPPWRFRT